MSQRDSPPTSLSGADLNKSKTQPGDGIDGTKVDVAPAFISMDGYELVPDLDLVRSLSLPATPSANKSAEDGVSGSKSAEALENTKSRDKKLKLKVSRGALAKARRSRGGTSSASSGGLGRSSESEAGEVNSRQHHPEGLETSQDGHVPGNNRITPTVQPSQQSRTHIDNAPFITRKTAAQDAFLALLSTDIDCVNGKALRRLKKRFPDLEARLAEIRSQLPEYPETAETLKIKNIQGIAASNSTQRAQAGRFRGRVGRWMRRARQAISRNRTDGDVIEPRAGGALHQGIAVGCRSHLGWTS